MSMPTQRFRMCLIILVLTSLFPACNDHRLSELTPSRLRIKILKNSYDNWTSEFIYDAQNRLSGITTTQTRDATRFEHTAYTYDNQNRVIEISRIIETIPQTIKTKLDRYNFSYTATGQVAIIRYVSNATDTLTFICKPEYDAANQLIGSQLSGTNSYITSDGSCQYTYENGNLTLVKLSLLSSNAPDPTIPYKTEFPFIYDNKLNPFYGTTIPISTPTLDPMPISPIAIFIYPPKNDGIANLMSLSRNNVLSDGYKNYRYTYNSAGLPLTRVGLRNGYNFDWVTETLYFTYESY